jgi:membrane protease YdiL (CAAX protease family)
MIEFLPKLSDKSIWIKFGTLLLIIAISMVLLMVIGFLIAIPFYGIGFIKEFGTTNDLSNQTIVGFLKYFQVINQIGVFVLPAIAFAYLEKKNVGNYLLINSKPQITSLIISILLIIASVPAINWMVGVNEQLQLPRFMKEIEDWIRDSEDNAGLLTDAFLNVNTLSGLFINLFIIAFLAAIGEEFLFRGVVLRILFDELKNPHIAVLLSSVLFSALHLQFFGFLPRTALGVLFGYVFLWTGSLWIPVILHFIFNGTTVVVAYLYQKGLISTDIESFGTTGNVWIILASFILTFIFLGMIFKRRRMPFFTLNIIQNTDRPDE